MQGGGGEGVGEREVMTAISTHWPGITMSGSADVGKAKGIFFLPLFLSWQMGNTNLFQHNRVSVPPHFCHLIRCKLHPLRPEVNLHTDTHSMGKPATCWTPLFLSIQNSGCLHTDRFEMDPAGFLVLVRCRWVTVNTTAALCFTPTGRY